MSAIKQSNQHTNRIYYESDDGTLRLELDVKDFPKRVRDKIYRALHTGTRITIRGEVSSYSIE